MRVRVWFKSEVVEGGKFAREGEFIEFVDNCVRFQSENLEMPVRYSVHDSDVLSIEFIR